MLSLKKQPVILCVGPVIGVGHVRNQRSRGRVQKAQHTPCLGISSGGTQGRTARARYVHSRVRLLVQPTVVRAVPDVIRRD